MEYKKKSLSKLDIKKDYEEIDTRLASGWYVDDINISKKKIYKTKKTSFKISKKITWWIYYFKNDWIKFKNITYKTHSLIKILNIFIFPDSKILLN